MDENVENGTRDPPRRIDEWRLPVVRRGFLTVRTESIALPVSHPRWGTLSPRVNLTPFSNRFLGGQRERMANLYAECETLAGPSGQLPSFPSRSAYSTTTNTPTPTSTSFERARTNYTQRDLNSLRKEIDDLKTLGQSILENQRQINSMMDRIMVLDRFNPTALIQPFAFSHLELLRDFGRQQTRSINAMQVGSAITFDQANRLVSELNGPTLTSLIDLTIRLRDSLRESEEVKEKEEESAKLSKNGLLPEDSINNAFDVPPAEFSQPATPVRCLSRSSEKAETARYMINNFNQRSEMADLINLYYDEESTENFPSDVEHTPSSALQALQEALQDLPSDQRQNMDLEWEDLDDDEDLDDKETETEAAYREWDLATRRENIMSLFDFQPLESEPTPSTTLSIMTQDSETSTDPGYYTSMIDNIQATGHHYDDDQEFEDLEQDYDDDNDYDDIF